MHTATLRLSLVCTLFLLSVPTSVAAEDYDQLSRTRTIEKWGRVIFCQRIYTLPEVKRRLYDFDIEHCDQAGQLMTSLVAGHSQQEQNQLKYEAEGHAKALSYNTSEPYHSVAACRSYCKELAEIREKRND